MQPSATPRRMAFFGGSFNPPHLGHQMAMLHALAMARVDGLIAVPCFRHPFAKPLAPFAHRLEMLRLACAPLAGATVSDVEARLGDSRTVRTVKTLQAENPNLRWVLVIGADLLAERSRWYGWQELEQLVELHVVGRGGHAAEADGSAVQLPEISSSDVRDRLARGESVAHLLPAAVVDYIQRHGLYRAP